MKILELYLQKINKELFSFSYTLLSDDLQAQQIVIDAIYVLTMKRIDLIRGLLETSHKLSQEDILFEMKIFIFKQIYLIGVKRVNHLGRAVTFDESYIAFYKLNFKERAMLFLKYKTKFSLSNISEVLDENEVDILSILSSGRKKLVKNMDMDLENLLG